MILGFRLSRPRACPRAALPSPRRLRPRCWSSYVASCACVVASVSIVYLEFALAAVNVYVYVLLSRPRPRPHGSLALLASTLTRPTVRASPRLARCIIIRIGTGTYHRSLRGVARMPLSIVSIQLYINQLIFVHPFSVSTSLILISRGSHDRLRARSVNTACYYCTRMLTSMTGRHGN